VLAVFLLAGLAVYGLSPRFSGIGESIGRSGILGGPAEAATAGWLGETAIVLENQPIATSQSFVGDYSATNEPGAAYDEANPYLATSLGDFGRPVGEKLASITGPSSNPDGFIMPADGYNWGQLHHYNAVDISNKCGTPVRASAEGLVAPDENFGSGVGGWNGGYGNFVLIEHPFGDGVMTRYAHLSKVLVNIGDYVKQGQEIGIVGETGDATGCHVHFEVYGAENPFAKS